MSQRDWLEKDYYKTLGVSPDASKDDIKKAYRRLAQKFHPDSDSGDEARFKEISEAHAILGNDDKRREYDQMRSLVGSGGQRFFGFTPGSGGGVRINIGDLFGGGAGSDVFEDLFGFRGGRRGADAESEVTLTFEEAVAGTTISLPGGGKVRVPAGVTSGTRIKVSGKGSPGPPGSEPGDLYVRVTVGEHALFRQGRNGDLVVTVPVTFPEAALGAHVTVPTLQGSVTVKVPAGTQHGATLRVRGKGGPRPSGGHGDLLAKIEVVVPRKLGRKEKEILENFAAIHKGDPRAHLDAVARAAKAS